MPTSSRAVFWSPKPLRAPRIRLFCFAHAGAGPHVFYNWQDRLPADVELWTAQLPGRGRRLGDPAHTRMAPLIDELSAAFEGDGPAFVLFGHSMGALVAIEMAHALRQAQGVEPSLLMVSGCRAPHLLRVTDLPIANDEALLERLREFDGTAAGVLQDPQLREMVLTALRADLTLTDAYRWSPRAPLACNVAAFGGLDDGWARRDEIEAWREYTAGRFSIELFPGGHFYWQSAADALLAAIRAKLSDL